MVGKRSYDDPCGVARALNIVGERWALLIVRELLLGPKRFSDLTTGLPGISENVLSQRLRELETADVVRRRQLGPPASIGVYELTDRGHELELVLLALGRWGSRAPLSSSAELSKDALLLALRTTFDPAAAADPGARIELRLGNDQLQVDIGNGAFTITRVAADHPDAVLATDAATLRSLVFSRVRLTAAVRDGDATAYGDRRVLQRFLRCFPRLSARHA